MPWDADPALENLDIGKAYSQCGINDPASFSVMRKIGMTRVNDTGTRTCPGTRLTSGEYTYMITGDEWEKSKKQ